jgi:hypothetical protein
MPAQEIEVVSRDETVKNEELLARVDGLLERAKERREAQEATFVEIGIALQEVQDSKAWMLRDFHSFDQYIREWCEPRYGRERNQLYGFKSSAKLLLPYFSPEELTGMGVTKALHLKTLVKETGKKPPERLSAAALDSEVKVKDFESLVAEARHMTPELGKWRQLSIRASDDEWEEIERAMKSALDQGENPLPPETSETMKRKIALLRMAAEFLSTYPCMENVKETA